MKFPEWVEFERQRAGLSLKAFGDALSEADGSRIEGPATQTISNWAKSYKRMSLEFKSMIAAYRRRQSGLAWTVEHIDQWFEKDIEPVPPRGRGDGRSLPDLINELKEVADTATRQEAAEVLIDLGSVLYQLIRVAIEEPIKPVPDNALLAYVDDLFKKHGQTLTEETISAARLRMTANDSKILLNLLSDGSGVNAEAIPSIRRLIKKALKVDVDYQSLSNLLEPEERSQKLGISEDLA